MYSKLKPGDLLHRSKGIVQHAGVFLGDGLVLHNQPSEGAQVTSYTQYAEGKKVSVTRIDNADVGLLSNRISEILKNDQRYGLLANNCEHVANLLINGQKMSPQLQACVAGSILGGLISSQLKGENWVYGIVLGGIAGVIISNLTREYNYHIEQSALHALNPFHS